MHRDRIAQDLLLHSRSWDMGPEQLRLTSCEISASEELYQNLNYEEGPLLFSHRRGPVIFLNSVFPYRQNSHNINYL